MRWMVAGLLFALAVSLAIATAALRADNVRARRSLEQQYRGVWTQMVEFKRLSVQQLESVAPEELARPSRVRALDGARARGTFAMRVEGPIYGHEF